MSVQFTSGDLLNCAQAVALVNPVNCVGVMGKGLALAFRKRWPENLRAYRSACAAGEVRIGAPHVYETLSGTHPRVIVNLPTKIHWRDPSELSFVIAGVDALARLLIARSIPSVAIPALGCGLGGLSWCDVRPLLEATFSPMATVDAIIFEPS